VFQPDERSRCCKFTKAFGVELKQMLNRVTELEMKMETNEQKLAEKDELVEKQNVQIQDQNKELEDLKKQNENQNREIKELQKQMNNNSDILILKMHTEDQKRKIVDQNKKIEDQNEKIVDQNKKIVDQNKKIEYQNGKIVDQNEEVRDQQIQLEQLDKEVEDQNEKIMIIPVTESFGSVSPFQWKFNPNELRVQGRKKYSIPFYNTMNSHCFQLGAGYKDNNLRISYHRCRGKYDVDLGIDIETKNTFDFNIKLFGKGGKLKHVCFKNKDSLIHKYGTRSSSRNYTINNDEINDLTIDGYLNLLCFFK